MRPRHPSAAGDTLPRLLQWDVRDDADEATLVLTLSQPPLGAGIDPAASRITRTITDDDAPPTAWGASPTRRLRRRRRPIAACGQGRAVRG
jgi:hypothetical protein